MITNELFMHWKYLETMDLFGFMKLTLLSKKEIRFEHFKTETELPKQ